MKPTANTPRNPEPGRVRTNRDPVMIVLGVGLIVFFVVAGYFGMTYTEKSSPGKPRGPVKDPHRVGFHIQPPVPSPCWDMKA